MSDCGGARTTVAIFLLCCFDRLVWCGGAETHFGQVQILRNGFLDNHTDVHAEILNNVTQNYYKCLLLLVRLITQYKTLLYLWMQAKEVHWFVFGRRWSEWTLAVEPQLWIRRALRWSSGLRGETRKKIRCPMVPNYAMQQPSFAFSPNMYKFLQKVPFKSVCQLYLRAMASGSLRGQSLYLFPVQLGSSTVVLGVCSVGCAPMLTKESHLGGEKKEHHRCVVSQCCTVQKVWAQALLSRTHCTSIPSDLHTSQLEPGPGKIQFSGSVSHTELDSSYDSKYIHVQVKSKFNRYILCLPDKGEVHPKRPVCPWAIDTYKDAIGDAGPAWIFGRAVKTNLMEKLNAKHRRLTIFITNWS